MAKAGIIEPTAILSVVGADVLVTHQLCFAIVLKSTLPVQVVWEDRFLIVFQEESTSLQKSGCHLLVLMVVVALHLVADDIPAANPAELRVLPITRWLVG